MHCGTLRSDEHGSRFCAGCGLPYDEGSSRVDTAPRGLPQVNTGLRLALLDSAGDVRDVIPLTARRAMLTADRLGLRVGEDFIGADGASLSFDATSIRLEPIGTPRALFAFITEPTRLLDGDLLLIGAQVIRYRALVDDGAAYFGDLGTYHVGSRLPYRDVAVLEQLRDDGRTRDTLYLWPGRTIVVGREEGDWILSYDPTVSGRHAIVTCDEDGSVQVKDAGSRNGVAIAVRSPKRLVSGQRVSMDGQLIRVDLA